MKQGQLKSILALVFSLIIMSFLIGAVTTTLLSPSDGFTDDDGFLDLRGSCTPSSQNEHDGTTSYNITNATLYSNVDGTWKANASLNVTTPIVNSTYFFNFTNHINQTAEGVFLWDIECHEANYTNDGNDIKTSFEGNRTIVVEYARPTVSMTEPTDGAVDLNGNNITIVCDGDPSGGWNVTSVDLLTNVSGTYQINSTKQVSKGPGVNFVTNFSFNAPENASLPSGSEIILSCSYTQRKTVGELGVSSEKSSTNTTLFVKYPPLVTLEKPDDGNWSKNLRTNLNWTVTNIHSGVTAFNTRIWTNESGRMQPETGTISTTNNSGISQDYIFEEKTAIVWAVQAFDQTDSRVSNFSVNRTINLDSITPVVTDNSTTVEGSVVTFTLTPIDTNLAGVVIFTDITNDNFSINYTNTSSELSSGQEIIVKLNALDGKYNYSIFVNDSAGNIFSIINSSFIVDLTPPNITVTGNTSTLNCTSRSINWITNESANSTFYINTDVIVTDGEIFTSSEKTINHSLDFDFGENTEVLHYFNITTCDVSGNCNTTGQMTFLTPASVCGGWSQYAIYHNEQSLLEIQNQSGADLVYFWNGTDQNWIFKTAGLTTNDNVIMGRDTDYHVAHLFENTNSTWFRNISNQGHYNFNLSEGNNFIAIPGLYNFGNLTYSFMNTSRQFPSFINESSSSLNGGTAGIKFGPFNVSYFAGYNNTLQDYVNHIFNFTWANATFLQPCFERTENPTCMETAWLASGFNMSWNGTQIYSNYTSTN